jgi:hypothetical protein
VAMCAVAPQDESILTIGTSDVSEDNWTRLGASYDAARVAGQAHFDRILSACRSQNKPFFDDSFFYDSTEVVFGSEPSAVARARALVEQPQTVRRLSSIKPFLPESAGGSYVASIRGSGAILPPAHFGGKYISDALVVLARADPSAPDPLQNVVFAHAPTEGIYGVMLFHPTKGWTYIIVDDWVAVSANNPTECIFGPEIRLASWPVVLFKALAKMYGSFGSLAVKGGRVGEVLGDLLGPGAAINELFFGEVAGGSRVASMVSYGSGVASSNASLESQVSCTLLHAPPPSMTSADLQEPVSSEDSSDPLLSPDWLFLTKAAAQPGVVVICEMCSNSITGSFGLRQEIIYLVKGVFTTFDARVFVRVASTDDEALNGYGIWTGAYSAGALDWVKNPLHVKQLKPERLPAGEFWMTMQDFSKYLGAVTVIRTAPPASATRVLSQVFTVDLPAAAKGVYTVPLAELSRELAAAATAGPVDLVVSVSQETLQGGNRASDYLSIGVACDGDSGSVHTSVTSAVRTMSPTLPLGPGVRCSLVLVVKAPATSSSAALRVSFLLSCEDVAVVLRPTNVQASLAQPASRPPGIRPSGSCMFGALRTLASFVTADVLDASFAEADAWGTGRASRKLAERAFLGIMGSLRNLTPDVQSSAAGAFAAAAQDRQQLDSEEFATVVAAALSLVE